MSPNLTSFRQSHSYLIPLVFCSLFFSQTFTTIPPTILTQHDSPAFLFVHLFACPPLELSDTSSIILCLLWLFFLPYPHLYTVCSFSCSARYLHSLNWKSLFCMYFKLCLFILSLANMSSTNCRSIPLSVDKWLTFGTILSENQDRNKRIET